MSQPTPLLPSDAAAVHPPTRDLLRWFDYEHLPAGRIRDTSAKIGDLAWDLAGSLPPSPELTVALRKLLEGKDAAVRSAIAADRADA